MLRSASNIIVGGIATAPAATAVAPLKGVSTGALRVIDCIACGRVRWLLSSHCDCVTAVCVGAVCVQSVPARVLTLKQLREAIDGIYTSKERFDKQCNDARLPRETVRVPALSGPCCGVVSSSLSSPATPRHLLFIILLLLLLLLLCVRCVCRYLILSPSHQPHRPSHSPHASVLAAVPCPQMEQHLYTYLNQKYGLKSLIVEHASCIIRAANTYADADNDVAVFVKILRCAHSDAGSSHLPLLVLFLSLSLPLLLQLLCVVSAFWFRADAVLLLRRCC